MSSSISSSTLNKLGKVAIQQVVAGKLQSEVVSAAESLWQSHPVTVVFVVRRPGKEKIGNAVSI